MAALKLFKLASKVAAPAFTLSWNILTGSVVTNPSGVVGFAFSPNELVSLL